MISDQVVFWVENLLWCWKYAVSELQKYNILKFKTGLLAKLVCKL